jgi:predicted CopG family antitoxin
MATRNISLDDEAYSRLKKLKNEGESFSEVIKNVTSEKSWLEVAGIWEDDTEDIREAVEEGRKKSRDRSDRIAEKLSD